MDLKLTNLDRDYPKAVSEAPGHSAINISDRHLRNMTQ